MPDAMNALYASDMSTTAPSAVTLDAVTLHRAGRCLLDQLSLNLPSAGITAVMGANGAGKSLLMRVVAGLLPVDTGQVCWWGKPLRPQRSIALVAQRPVLLRRSVADNLAHTLALCQVPRRQRRAHIAHWLERAHLTHLTNKPARVLSGGEQQRLAMVRALAQQPRLLLLDEPTASLDPRSTAAIEDMARAAVAEGIALVLVTHDAGQARRLADHIAFIHAGRIVEHTSTAQLLSAPASEAAHAYLEGRLLF